MQCKGMQSEYYYTRAHADGINWICIRVFQNIQNMSHSHTKRRQTNQIHCYEVQNMVTFFLWYNLDGIFLKSMHDDNQHLAGGSYVPSIGLMVSHSNMLEDCVAPSYMYMLKGAPAVGCRACIIMHAPSEGWSLRILMDTICSQEESHQKPAWTCTGVMDRCGFIAIKKSFTRQIGTSFLNNGYFTTRRTRRQKLQISCWFALVTTIDCSRFPPTMAPQVR